MEQKGGMPMAMENGERDRWLQTFKKMCRLLEIARHDFLDKDWYHFAMMMPHQQFTHLMMVRLAVPCNLSQIMSLTGMTSAGASIFVNKMVKRGIFQRTVDPEDRRNVIISFTDFALLHMKRLEKRLDDFICGFYPECSEEELEILGRAGSIVCRTLASYAGEPQPKNPRQPKAQKPAKSRKP